MQPKGLLWNPGHSKSAVSPSPTDSEVRKAVNDALLYDPRVNSFDIDVGVSNGLVTLRGVVSNLRAQRSAEQDARNTVGAYTVSNRIKVRPEDSISSEEASKFSDDTIESYVETALRRNPYLEEHVATADVNDGVVKLHGTVESWFQKSQAEEEASTVAGVVDVKNNINVEAAYENYTYEPYVDDYDINDYDWYDYTPGETVESDIEIAAEIREELRRSPLIDSDEIIVSVKNGRATLAGTVDSWTERATAAENAIEGGAVSVTNNLEVE